MEEMTMEEEEEEAETTRKFVNFHRIRTRKMPGRGRFDFLVTVPQRGGLDGGRAGLTLNA